MSLELDTFLAGSRDFESRQYLILQGLKEEYESFSHNRLYPGLAHLIDIHRILEGLIQKRGDIQRSLPQELKEVDPEKMQLIYEHGPEADDEVEKAMNLILWAMPYIKKTMDEGMQIYNFVEEHLAILEIGIMPMYRDEGYWFVPDARAHQLHLLRYQISLFASANERYRTLRTRTLESMEQNAVKQPPESIKLMLVQKYQDLPNPATFMCETDIDFPYMETILPVAKRKLMAHLFS